MLDRAKSLWPNQDFGLILKPEQQILSPSDFGFHNALRSKKKSLVFLDFEYFGWDDPIKLMCDFAFHPGMDLNQEMRKYWFQSTLKLYGDELLHRLNASWPLYGLCWTLISINDSAGPICPLPSTSTISSTNLRKKFERSSSILIKIKSLSFYRIVNELKKITGTF